MSLLQLAFRMAELKRQIETKTRELKAMRLLLEGCKFENPLLLEKVFEEEFDKTVNMISEFEFYKNQMEVLDNYVEIKMY